jgi:septum formation protein
MPAWLADRPLVLASRSKARQMLLEAAGIPIEIRPADIDERGLEAAAGTLPPDAVATMLAREKAMAVAKPNPGRLVLGADQTLALGAARFAKPADRTAARGQLQTLRDKTHALHSALVFVENGKVLFEHVGTAHLTMCAFSDSFLETYLDAVGGAATESVGAYQIEGLGAQLFERIDGDYFTMLGLPLMQALHFLRQRGHLAS